MAERQDWTLFRTVEGLQQKAGVPAARLRRLVFKELADNGFDEGAQVTVNRAEDGATYVVTDDGPGLEGTPEEIAALFSIARALRSSKLLRLPSRGALGNGLRVVAGAVLASQGKLVISTRNRRMALAPQLDGSTRVLSVTPVKQPQGTRIEIKLGPELPGDEQPLEWAGWAGHVARAGKEYRGRSSPHWYDAPAFHELILAYGASPLRALIAELDGCTHGKAGEIVSAAGLEPAHCDSLTRQEAETLLRIACGQTQLVSPDRLGAIGREPFPEMLTRSNAAARPSAAPASRW